MFGSFQISIFLPFTDLFKNKSMITVKIFERFEMFFDTIDKERGVNYKGVMNMLSLQVKLSISVKSKL